MECDLPDDSPLRVLQCLTGRWIAVVHFVGSLRATRGKLREHLGEFFILPSIMSRREKNLEYGYRDGILIPKALFGDISASLLKRFCTASEVELAAEFCQALNLPRSYHWKSILQSLEATAFLGEIPPLLVANLNFVVDMAQPAGTCRGRKLRQRYRQWDTEYPVFSVVTPKITAALNRETREKIEIFGRLDIPSAGDDQLLCRVALFYATDYLKTPDIYRERFKDEFKIAANSSRRAGSTKVPTDKKIMQTLPDALHLVRDAQLNCRMTSVLRITSGVIWASGLVRPHTDFLKAYHHPIIRLPREIPLIDPYEILNRYAIDSPPPSTADLKSRRVSVETAAFRVLRSILVHGWQRHCSLIHLKLCDFLLDGEHPETHILWTKMGLVNQSISLWGIMPDEEIAGLRRFIRFCDEELHLPGETLLTKLAGFGEFQGATSSVAQKLFCQAMGRLVPEFLESTHIPRATGLSWAPVRALAAFYPQVLSHPTLVLLRGHPWFSESELRKFRAMLAANNTDSVELFRRIACWTTSEQFVSTYCRSSHVLLQLWCFLQDSKSRDQFSR